MTRRYFKNRVKNIENSVMKARDGCKKLRNKKKFTREGREF